MGEREIGADEPVNVVEAVALHLTALWGGDQPPLSALPDQAIGLDDQDGQLGGLLGAEADGGSRRWRMDATCSG